MTYTRNHDPNYFEECQSFANCGSFAFIVEEWYSPDEYFEDDMGQTIEQWIDRCVWNGWDVYDMSNEFAGILVNYILNDFDDVRYLIWEGEIQPDEELIAVRTFVDTEGDWDFHFKVFRDGLW